MTPFFWFRWIRRIVLSLLLVAVIGFGSVAVHVWWVGRHDDHPRSDALVVLGAAEYNGTPSSVFRARLDHAKALYDEHVAPRIVTVGGKQSGDSYTEAGAAQQYLEHAGVPGDAILPVPTGHDTLQSLRAVAQVFHQHRWHSAVLVTDPWHCLRSRTMARDLGVDAHTSPEPTGPAVESRTTELRYITRETLAYVYYRIFGNDSVHSTGAV